MRMTLIQLIDTVAMRLKAKNLVPEAAIILEINNALEELHGKIRAQRGEQAVSVDTIDIVGGRDIYPLPEACGDPLMVERLDLRGAVQVLQRLTLTQGDTADMLLQIQGAIQEGYVLASGNIRLCPAPTTDFADGLRVTYHRRAERLTQYTQVPSVPDEIHEWLVVGALDRLRQYDGVKLASPQDYESFRQGQNQRLEKYLSPSHIDRPALIGDEDELYLSMN